jgi:hypothetical protein
MAGNCPVERAAVFCACVATVVDRPLPATVGAAITLCGAAALNRKPLNFVAKSTA